MILAYQTTAESNNSISGIKPNIHRKNFYTNCSKNVSNNFLTGRNKELDWKFIHNTLKDKPGVDIIVDYSRDYTVVNGV